MKTPDNATAIGHTILNDGLFFGRIFLAFAAIALGVRMWSFTVKQSAEAIRLQDTSLTLVIVAIAVGAFFYAYAQLRLTMLQIAQADMIAEHKDDALIAAIASLTTELQKRPEPAATPVVFNVTLFGRNQR
jgi:hypothetical protein